MNVRRIPSIIHNRKSFGINNIIKNNSLNSSRENSINKQKIYPLKNHYQNKNNPQIRMNKLIYEKEKFFTRDNYSSYNLTRNLNNTILVSNLTKSNSNSSYVIQTENSSINLENFYINISLSQKNKFEKEEYKRLLSKLVRIDYSESILKSLFDEETINESFLSYHKITDKMRTRMIDWMIEVLSNYKCDESTFFESVNIMDRYFKECEKKNIILLPQELHLIGIVSMFIASKYQDIYPLRLKIMHEKIAHRKLSCDDIKKKEEEITRFLNYSIGKPTMWDFINFFIEEIFFVENNNYHINSKILLEYTFEERKEKNKDLCVLVNKLYTENMVNLLKCVSLYLAKMNCHDYILMQKKKSLIAASTIFVGMKICEQINKEQYFNEYFLRRLIWISQKNENEIIKYAQRILNNAQNFESVFGNLENLKKVHFNVILGLKNTK